MSYASGLGIRPRELSLYKTVAFTWLFWDSIKSTNELHERNRTRRPAFYLLRRLGYQVSAVFSAIEVVRSIWRLMSS